MPLAVQCESTSPWVQEAGIAGLLGLSPVGPDRFEGWCHAGAPGRGFGGQVAAQGLLAAGLTVPGGQSSHSLHAYFLHATDPERPVTYEAERLRDGSAYAARRVIARQGGREVFSLTASFKRSEPTAERQSAMPLVPGLAAWHATGAGAVCSARPFEVLDLRLVQQHELLEGRPPGSCRQHMWLRASRPMPDDPLLHAAALVYGSDLLLAAAAALHVEDPVPVRAAPPKAFLTSLDHAVWFHRPFRLDEWLLFDQRSPTAGDGRGFAQGDLWSRGGELVASVTQEAVLRPLR